ncbi:polysaccharide pyruvyl transferase family protein [Bifidobacterium mongoliense]|uniref:polysaccharide pyruvyl transferase family protein n=1 Tax=Bifidobacterium mongoliense TaxID=518643 RepID=UPI0030EB7EEF
MKIGIVTFHCAYNYGSVLQTWALKSYLEQHGHEVYVIDYRSRNFNQYRLLRFHNVKNLISDIAFLPRNIQRKSNFSDFQSKYLNLTDQRYEGKSAEADLRRDSSTFDAIICGSDQIWNLDATYGIVGPFFLSFADSGVRKIAYAPSIGHEHFQNNRFNDDAKQRLSELLNEFHAISVREASTAPLFQRLTDVPISITVDPTLLLDVDQYKSIEAKTLPARLERGKYIFAYTLWQNESLRQFVDRLAVERHLTVVCCSKIPLHFRAHSMNLYGMSPTLFLSLIDHAEYVVSNSFHATVFSLIFHKPFITFSQRKSVSRMRDLLKELELTNHLVNDDYTGDKLPSGADYHRVDRMLKQLRMESEQFLDSALDE